jgi:hypothetical protein
MDHVADIAEAVAIGVRRYRRSEPHPVRRDEIGRARGMHAQHHDHRRRLRALIGDFVAGANFHHGLIFIKDSFSSTIVPVMAVDPAAAYARFHMRSQIRLASMHCLDVCIFWAKNRTYLIGLKSP